MITLQDFSDRFDAVRWRSSSSFQCRCPAHDDRRASLSVSVGDNGGVVLYCHAGCATKDVLQAVGLSFPDISPEENSTVTDQFDFRNITAEYCYSSSLRKIRDGNKNFLWQHREPDGTWKAGRGQEPHVLYHAGIPDQKVYVCEGEKDADKLSELGLFCVSSENGAGPGEKKWFSEYNAELKDHDCVLLPDNDEVGQAFMQYVKAQLRNHVKSVKVLDLTMLWPELPMKGDISDVIDRFGAYQTRMLLLALEERTDGRVPETESSTPAVIDAVDVSEDMDLERDSKGRTMPTIHNFHRIMHRDPFYEGVLFNLMTGRPEIHDGGNRRSWTDADEAMSRAYIEEKYGIYHTAKHGDALRMLFREREYNPLMDLVDSFEWDGEERCEIFLSAIMRAEDTPYTREVSKLIFAGGINRLRSPGCKFDDVPVLIGPQGSGKSTIVNWLALHDDYYATTKNMSGDQKSIEALQGSWIIEIPELAAFRAADVESLKAFVTTRSDKYRRPFDRNTSMFPRRCIFIGTTNNPEFLTDKTGNRRFYPVKVKSTGYELYDNKEDIQEFICQCWAEARVRYENGTMPPVADPGLIAEYRKAQSEAMEDDWRVGAVEQYLARLTPGECICAKEIFEHALYPDLSQKPGPKDSREIAQILDGFKNVRRVGLRHTVSYGRQRCWEIVP